MIKAEGLDSLTDDELRTACKARGLKAAYGEGAASYMRKQMQVRRQLWKQSAARCCVGGGTWEDSWQGLVFLEAWH